MGERTQSGVAGAQLAAAAPPSEALDPSAFYSLYLGGLSFPDRQQRLRASIVLTLGGRLGLRPGEIQHLHEEWVDWGRGELVVPDRDPCACKQCWEAARHAQRAGDGRRLLDIVTESTWSPPGEGRTIPFGWSQRLTAVIAMLCEEEGYLDLTAEAMSRLVGQSARRAEGLSQDAVGVDSLRATAVAFFADAGFSPRRVAALVGEEIDYTQAVARQAGGDARERLSELFDGGVADPGDAYALVADPEPFDAEPFDPRTYDAEWRQTRMRQRANEPEALRNPRPMTAAANDALDSSDLGTRAYLDADSDLVDEANAAARLDQWVTRQEAGRRDREPTSVPGSSQPDGADTASAQQSRAATDQSSGTTAGGQATAADGQSRGSSPQQPGPSQPQQDGSAGTASSGGSTPPADQRSQASAEGTGGTGGVRGPAGGPAGDRSGGATGGPAGGTTEDPPGGPTGGAPGDPVQDTDTDEPTTTVGDAEVFNARDHLSGPPAQTVETRVACSEFADGRPTAARVFIGPEELLFVRNDDDSMAPEHAKIELSAVVDLSMDYLPDPLKDAFESAVTVAYNRGEGRKLAVVGVTGNERISFANGVFKQVLTECEIVITHPARRGGRVMSTDAVGGTLSVDDRSVSITVDDETEDLTVQLSDVIYFELEKQTYEEQRFRSLSVRHLNSASEAIKTTIAVRDERKHKLFQRFVRRSYQQRKEKIESLTLTEEYKEVLVALYSAGDQFDISMIIDKPADELQELLRSLGQVGLARMSDNGAVLTGLGHVVVNEKIEDVNV